MGAPPGFVPPDFAAPLDVDAALALIPATATVKGMFFTDIYDMCARASVTSIPARRVIGFKEYPLTDFARLVVDAAAALHPDVPVREGLRRMGRSVYQTFSASMIGRVIFGVLDGDVPATLRAAGRAYSVAASVGSASCTIVDERAAIMHLVDIYLFIDCYQVGVFEGGLAALRRRGNIQVRVIGPTEGELYVTWD